MSKYDICNYKVSELKRIANNYGLDIKGKKKCHLMLDIFEYMINNKGDQQASVSEEEDEPIIVKSVTRINNPNKPTSTNRKVIIEPEPIKNVSFSEDLPKAYPEGRPGWVKKLRTRSKTKKILDLSTPEDIWNANHNIYLEKEAHRMKYHFK